MGQSVSPAGIAILPMDEILIPNLPLIVPPAMASIPASFLGGWMKSPKTVIIRILGAVLMVGTWFGSRWGSGRFKILAFRPSPAAVLVLAAAKFLII